MASKNNTAQATTTERYADIKNERPEKILLPIEGYQDRPIVSLEEAVKSIEHLVPGIEVKVYVAKQNCKRPSAPLNQDEAAAIQLYTIESINTEQSLYFVLSQTLRSENRQKLKPWFSYLKLLLTALSKLPTVSNTTVYRGVKTDLSKSYVKNQIVVWWGFSSCTQSIGQSEQFLGKTGNRTLFSIECQNGRNIQNYSFIPAENEILLLPAIHLQVVSSLTPAVGIHMIQLKEVNAPFRFLDFPVSPPTPEKAPTSETRKGNVKDPEPKKESILMTKPTPEIIATTGQFKAFVIDQSKQPFSETYRNKQLEQFIEKNKTSYSFDLKGKQLNDEDMKIISNEIKINSNWSSLSLTDNEITGEQVRYLCEALQTNTKVSTLTLNRNKLSDTGASFVAKLLLTNKTLTSINLSDNHITDEGILISESLKVNTSLQSLSLWNNQITDEGLSSLIQVLKTSDNFQNLSFGANQITDKSVHLIIELVEISNKLTALNLNDNQISKDGGERIKQAAKKNWNIQHIYV
ncbi:unnamed protein product [Didymodactylos carnosus]|uniref:NAD(P)(+)--arginine ADP-ribosyltransferase n=1 Tax=Didymodactylos carnosus TaxID=1234261 RepID=A0A8S2QNH4_9BILA|nr:unnamed protein product [Didymodactylos carnosus]CAF4117083.1 unnamed protein product [Didymodactylos carnosus]